MYFLLVILFCLLGLGMFDPKPHQQASWPWLTRPGQSATPAYWETGSWSNGGGGGDARGEGWGNMEDNPWGSDTWGSNGQTSWGSRTCGGAIRRPRCAPSANEIEQRLLGAGKKMAEFCSAYSDRPLREIYGVDHFKLRVRLSEFTEDDIQVRVRQRLVTILAKTCSAEYAAVRILPDVVDSRHGMWKMERHTLTVLFPYTITPDTEIQSRCGREFDPDPIIVPKSAEGTVFARDYDVSFNDVNLRRAIRKYLEELVREDNTEYVD